MSVAEKAEHFQKILAALAPQPRAQAVTQAPPPPPAAAEVAAAAQPDLPVPEVAAPASSIDAPASPRVSDAASLSDEAPLADSQDTTSEWDQVQELWAGLQAQGGSQGGW